MLDALYFEYLHSQCEAEAGCEGCDCWRMDLAKFCCSKKVLVAKALRLWNWAKEWR